MSVFENDLQRLTFLKRTIALLSSMVDGGECHTNRSKEMKNNAQRVILEMEANTVKTSERNCNIPQVMPSIYGIFNHGTDKVYGYYWNLDVAEEVCDEMKGEDYYVDELCVDEH